MSTNQWWRRWFEARLSDLFGRRLFDRLGERLNNLPWFRYPGGFWWLVYSIRQPNSRPGWQRWPPPTSDYLISKREFRRPYKGWWPVAPGSHRSRLPLHQAQVWITFVTTELVAVVNQPPMPVTTWHVEAAAFLPGPNGDRAQDRWVGEKTSYAPAQVIAWRPLTRRKPWASQVNPGWAARQP